MAVKASSPIFAVAVLILAVVLGLGLLYAYRSQTPAIPQIAMTQAIQEIQQARVSDVGIEGNRATLALVDDTREVVSLPDPVTASPLVQAVIEYNRANPSRPITLRFDQGTPFPGAAVGILLSLLPLVVLVALVVALAALLARSARSDRYERLARAADLRDRGVLTEDEFQREKRKILG